MHLTRSDCKASKNISNDTKPEPISWELDVGNLISHFCVVVWVRGHDAANFSHASTDAQDNFTSFDTNVVMVCGGASMVFNEKPTKKIRGVEIAWVKAN